MSISTASLKSGMRTGGDGEHKGRLRNGLVMAEVALALVLLISAGLLIQSFARLGQVQTGMRPDHLLTARISLPEFGLSEERKHHRILRSVCFPKIRALPGVESASTIVPLPLSSSNMVTGFDIAEHPLPEGQRERRAGRGSSRPITSRPIGNPGAAGSRLLTSTTRFNSRAGRDRERALRAEVFPGSERDRQTDHARL